MENGTATVGIWTMENDTGDGTGAAPGGSPVKTSCCGPVGAGGPKATVAVSCAVVPPGRTVVVLGATERELPGATRSSNVSVPVATGVVPTVTV
jgi:hypothetical protein